MTELLWQFCFTNLPSAPQLEYSDASGNRGSARDDLHLTIK